MISMEGYKMKNKGFPSMPPTLPSSPDAELLDSSGVEGKGLGRASGQLAVMLAFAVHP